MFRDCKRGGAGIYFLGLQFTSLQIKRFLVAGCCQGHFVSRMGGKSELP